MGRLAKLARLVGAIGGIGALVWVMRDRFVSIGPSPQPAPPNFRTHEEHTTSTAEAPHSDDLTEVNGIGPVYAERLRAAGVTSFAAIAASTETALAEAAGIAESRVSDWRAAARQLAQS